MRGVAEYNPATRARPPRLVRESSHTLVFEEAEVVAFLDSINPDSLKDIRDRAIFSVLLYAWCRVSAVISLHSKAKEAVAFWLERSRLASKPSAPLFPSFGKNRETIEQRRLDRRSVLKLVEKRAKASGIEKSLLSQLPCDGRHRIG